MGENWICQFAIVTIVVVKRNRDPDHPEAGKGMAKAGEVPVMES